MGSAVKKKIGKGNEEKENVNNKSGSDRKKRIGRKERGG